MFNGIVNSMIPQINNILFLFAKQIYNKMFQ